MSSLSLETPAWFAIQFMGVPLPAVLGGLLIGLAAVVLYLSIGRIVPVSAAFFSARSMKVAPGAGCSSPALSPVPGW
jgi:biotin transporter BioY